MFIWRVIAQQTVIMTEFKFLKSESKIAPVHSMEVYGGPGCLNPLIRNLCTIWRRMISFTFPLLMWGAGSNRWIFGWVGPMACFDALDGT